MARPSPYPAELRRRAVRMVAEVRPDYKTEWGAMKTVASKVGIGTAETVRQWGRRDQDSGIRPGTTTEESVQVKGTEEGSRRAQAGERDPQGGLGILRGRARLAPSSLVTFIDEHRDRFGGVEPMCTVLTRHGLNIAPSTYYAAKARRPSSRTVRDAELKVLVQEVFDANYRVYGARKIWHHLRRQGHQVARCTVERLTRELGISGAVRGRKVATTV